MELDVMQHIRGMEVAQEYEIQSKCKDYSVLPDNSVGKHDVGMEGTPHKGVLSPITISLKTQQLVEEQLGVCLEGTPAEGVLSPIKNVA
jgi:hypothetical protein